MAIEIVSFPIKNGDFPVRYVTNYQRVPNDLTHPQMIPRQFPMAFPYRTCKNPSACSSTTVFFDQPGHGKSVVGSRDYPEPGFVVVVLFIIILQYILQNEVYKLYMYVYIYTVWKKKTWFSNPWFLAGGIIASVWERVHRHFSIVCWACLITALR